MKLTCAGARKKGPRWDERDVGGNHAVLSLRSQSAREQAEGGRQWSPAPPGNESKINCLSEAFTSDRPDSIGRSC